MKKIIIFLVFLFLSKTYAQNGRVTYVASSNNFFNHVDLKNKSIDVIAAYNEANNSSENIEYELIFNKNNSFFKKKDGIDNKNNFTNIYVGRGSHYYNRKTNKTILENDYFGETFLIEKENIKWNISNETKRIGEYNCIKATAVFHSPSRRGLLKQEVNTWFVPSLPLNFGPKNFNGLPGLIISLEVVGRYYFNAVKIELDIDKIEIKIPTKGERLTQKTFDKILKDFSENRSGFIYNRKKYFPNEK